LAGDFGGKEDGRKVGTKKQTARSFRHEPSGGLLWIDQEVVTLRGLFGNSGLPARPSSRADFNPYSPIVCGL